MSPTDPHPEHHRPSLRRARPYLYLAFAALTLAAILYLAIPATSNQDPRGSDDPPKRVLTASVEAMESRRELRFAGVTRAAQRARLSFLVGGRLSDRPVDVGDEILKGQLLARLDTSESRNAVDVAAAQLKELQARRDQAERDVERVEALVASKAATREELEQVRAGLDALSSGEESARVRLREAQRRLGETTLHAPYAGTVTEVHAEAGEFVSAGRPLLTLSGGDAVELEVEVPETVVPQLEVGDPVKVYLPALDTERTARITSLGRAAPGPGQLFPVRVQFDAVGASPLEGRLRPGMTAELVLGLTSPYGLTLPVEAVINPGGRQPAVFRITAGDRPSTSGAGRQGTVERIEVQVGRLLGERVTVSGPLDVGDEVVVGGHRGLLDGESVTVVTSLAGDRR